MPRHAFLLLVLLAAATLLPSGARAQAMSRADSAAVLLSAARAFQAEGRPEVAEALLHYIGERFGDTPSGADALLALRSAPPEGASRASQVELMVWSATYGAWLGVGIPGAFGAGDPGPYGAGLLLGGPAGFLAGRALSRSRSLSEGQVRAITFGSLWGGWQGFGLMEVMDWGRSETCHFDYCDIEDPSSEAVWTSMVLGSLAGVATGAYLARRPISSGRATTVNFGALWGTWFGLAGGVLAGMEGDQLLTTTLLGGNAGLLATAYYDRRWQLSRPRARLVSIAGVLGLLGGLGLDLLAQPDNGRVAMAIPLATSVAGLAIGALNTSDRPGSEPGGAAGSGSGADGSGGWGRGLVLTPPTLYPVFLPGDGQGTRRGRPALGINLISARF